MNDGYVSKASALAMLFWGLAGVMVCVVWVGAVAHIERGYLTATALTAVLVIALASVWQIRLFVMRLCVLVRVTMGLQSPDAELHTIGSR